MSLLKIEIPPELEVTLRNRAADQGQDLEVFVLDVLKDAAMGPELPASPPNREQKRADRTPPAPTAESGEDDEGQAPWRGVFVVEPHRRHSPSCSTPVSVRLSDLARWRPEVVIPQRWLDADDE
jgi:hypothetical protein